MIFKLNFLLNIRLLFIVVFLLSFNVSVSHAKKIDLAVFKGKLSGSLLFTSDVSYENIQFNILNLTTGEIKSSNQIVTNLHDFILETPELSPLKNKILVTGYFSKSKDSVISQILVFNLKSHQLTKWSYSKSQYSNPRYSSDGLKILFSNNYLIQNSEITIFNKEDETIKKLPCPKPKQCIMANWNKLNDHIVFINDLNSAVNEINLKTNEIKIIYKTQSNEYLVSYPNYMQNGNIIFTEIYEPQNNNVTTKIIKINNNRKNNSVIFKYKGYIAGSTSLNKENYIAFYTIEKANNTRITILDLNTNKNIIISLPKHTLSLPVWRP